jgi:glutamine cyclotransferase
MNSRKRKVKDVAKKDEIQVTKRGRQVRKVNYEQPNYLDDSSEEE